MMISLPAGRRTDDGQGPGTCRQKHVLTGTKTPKVTINVETNDVNPLNAGDYLLSDGSAYADIVEFFAANLNKETVNGVVRPTLYLNDKMTNLLEKRRAPRRT